MNMALIMPSFLLAMTMVFLCVSHSNSLKFNYPAVFNFGDSNSDTGGLIALALEPLHPPNGQTYFKKPSGRFSDGRLILDFWMNAIDFPFLNPYLDSFGAPNFTKGCNFAVANATIQPSTVTRSISPFSFGVQVDQFFIFRQRVTDVQNNAADYFQKGLYMFDIGQNDLAGAFYSKTLDQVLASIPTLLSEFEDAIKKLYDGGARNFWIHNTGPLGCLPRFISKFGTDPSKLDKFGCLTTHNQAAISFNLQLQALCKKLRSQYTDSNVTYVDIFTIKLNLIANYSQYGFEQPLMACCGYGGPPYNHDSRVACGETKVINGSSITAKACNDSTKYVSWDGIHYTETANQYVVSQILTGKYFDPPFDGNVQYLRKLKFLATR